MSTSCITFKRVVDRFFVVGRRDDIAQSIARHHCRLKNSFGSSSRCFFSTHLSHSGLEDPSTLKGNRMSLVTDCVNGRRKTASRHTFNTERWKHSARMGHKLDNLDEMAHRPEREAAEERRKKTKERKAAKRTKKKEGASDDNAGKVNAMPDLNEEEEEDTFILDDDSDDHDDDSEGGEDEEPSLPNPGEIKERMMSVVNKFQESLKTIRGAQPTPEMFDDVKVNAYGSVTPIKAVGQVVIVSPTLAQITCFDPSVAKGVQNAIQLILELNPQVEEGGIVRVPLPRVSIEVRQQTAKQLHKKAEACKQRLRQVRRKAMDVVKKGKDGKLAGISKDDAFARGKDIETVTETVLEKLKEIVDEKMDSIMAV